MCERIVDSSIVKLCDVKFGEKIRSKGRVFTRGKYFNCKDIEYSSIDWIDIEIIDDNGVVHLMEKNTLVEEL